MDDKRQSETIRTLEDIQPELRFDGWWMRQRDKEWVEVAEGTRRGEESLFGTSWLVPASETGDALNKTNWDLRIGNGLPGFGQEGLNPEIVYLPVGTFPGQPIPFVIWRDFHGLFPNEIEVFQEFILYHDLYFDGQAHIKPITEETVIEYERVEDDRLVRVRRDALCDFLAARKAILVRGFDNRRHMKLPRIPQISSYFKSEDSSFHLYAGEDPGVSRKADVFVRMLGRYIVRPFKQPLHPSFVSMARRDREEKRVPFEIKRDADGNIVQAGLPKDADYLTPVFFKGEVLQKYYNQPRIYEVEASLIRHLYEWSITYGKNPKGFVHAWLGDLWRDLPYEEQLYWRSYNVLPSGGLEESFVRGQLFAEFVDTEREDQVVVDARARLNRAWTRRFTFPLFKELPEHENYVFSSIHTPLTSELKEFSEQIILLAKLFVECINIDGLRAKISVKEQLRDSEGNLLPSLATLEVFVDEHAFRKQTQQLLDSLRKVQLIRSKSVHSVSSTTFKNALQRAGFKPNQPLPVVFDTLVSQLRRAMDSLASGIASATP